MAEPCQLLQINVISAQDLAPVSRSMHTYAVAWINPDRKMTTRVDQKGNNSPQWNDKFVFRVNSEFLNSDSAVVVIEVYSQSWIRDVPVGSVRVTISSVIPASGSLRRAVALQVRRPSGRPQGILNIAVSILDAANRSMPLSALDLPEEKARPEPGPGPGPEGSVVLLRRTKSERSWSVNEDVAARPRSTGPGSIVGGSMCNSDVGPSPSIVAAAVAKGLYIPPNTRPRGGRGSGCGGGGVKDDGESSILQWADEQSEEGLRTKIERWRTELHHPMGGGDEESLRPKRRHRRRKTEGARLFKCFGKAYGFEFTIVCGANQGNDNGHDNNKNGKKNKHNKKKMILSPSDCDGNSSYVSL